MRPLNVVRSEVLESILVQEFVDVHTKLEFTIRGKCRHLVNM